MTNTTIMLWNGRTMPRLGMGCWAIGGPFYAGDVPLGWGEVDDGGIDCGGASRARPRDRILRHGIDYGAGHSEAVLGRALEGRTDVVVATKFGFATDPATKQATGAFADEAFIRASVETSLRRLKRERLDLLQFHLNDFDPAASDDVFDVLERLRTEGKIDAFGWSTDFADRAERHATREGFVAVQHNMNVLSPATDVLGVIAKHGLISIDRGPLAMGLLSGKFSADKAIGEKDVRGAALDWMVYFKDGRAAPEFARMLDAVRDLLRTEGRTLSQGALGWLWAKYDRTLPIPGFRTVAQVEENAGALAKGPLPKAVAEEIDAVLKTTSIAA